MANMAKRREYLNEDRVARFLDRNLWLRLVALLKDHKATASLAFLFLIISEILPVFQPQVLKGMIDGPIKHKQLDGITPYMLAFVALVLLSGALEYLRAVASQKLGLTIIHELRVRIFARLQRFHMDFFHRTPVGRLMTRMGNDIDSLSGMFTEGLIELIGALLMILFAVGFMLALDWKLALASLAVLPLMLITTSIFREKVRANNSIIRKLLAELNSIMQESLAGIHIVRIFGKVSEQIRNFDAVNKQMREEWFKNVKYYSVFFPVINGLTEISLALLYFTGAWFFFRHSVSLGTLVAFSWYTGLFFRPLRELSDKITALQSALAAAERVFTLSDTEAFLPAGNLETFPDTVDITFDDVTFGYDPDKIVLANVSFQVKPGQSVAIVGATGSGKSTTIALANKFYLPDTGRVLIGGQPIETYSEAALRKNISLISQDVYLFSESIAFNVALSPEFSLERVEEVCRYVNAHEFISALPQGYLTPLRERGENLSTGQRQLLAFARALYHRPKILLMDEATSSVDTETESLVQQALDKILKNLTSIVVAHRLSTIQNADKILVMHKGRIREEGRHHELLKLGGIYHKLYELQRYGDDEEIASLTPTELATGPGTTG